MSIDADRLNPLAARIRELERKLAAAEREQRRMAETITMWEARAERAEAAVAELEKGLRLIADCRWTTMFDVRVYAKKKLEYLDARRAAREGEGGES